MSRATKLRFGAIGVGNYALGYHLPIIKSSQDAELVAIHRRSPDRLADAAKSFKVAHAFTDYVAMLDSVELDAVVVSGPTGLHYEYCRAALEHGLHVLVDKPWVVRTAEAEDLLALARRKGLVLSVSYNRHFDPANMCARNVMQSGQLGEIICASASDSCVAGERRSPNGSWRSGKGPAPTAHCSIFFAGRPLPSNDRPSKTSSGLEASRDSASRGVSSSGRPVSGSVPRPTSNAQADETTTPRPSWRWTTPTPGSHSRFWRRTTR